MKVHPIHIHIYKFYFYLYSFDEWLNFSCRDDLLIQAYSNGFDNRVGEICFLHFKNDMFQSDGKLIENAKPTEFNVNISIKCKNSNKKNPIQISSDGNDKNILKVNFLIRIHV